MRRQNEELVARLTGVEREYGIYRSQRKPWVAGTSFMVVMPIAWRDFAGAVRLLDWIARIGGTKHQRLAIVYPHDLPMDLRDSLERRAKASWGTVDMVERPIALPKEHWPMGPNWSFVWGSQWAHRFKADFLLLEPDAVPLHPRWLDAIISEYRGCGRPYMGVYEPPGPQHQMHLAGTAVYQWEVYQRFHWHEMERAWDVAVGPTLVAEAHESKTIQQVWGEWEKPPTFTTQADLSILRPGAALFHRNKDGSLIDRLRETL